MELNIIRTNNPVHMDELTERGPVSCRGDRGHRRASAMTREREDGGAWVTSGVSHKQSFIARFTLRQRTNAKGEF